MRTNIFLTTVQHSAFVIHKKSPTQSTNIRIDLRSYQLVCEL